MRKYSVIPIIFILTLAIFTPVNAQESQFADPGLTYRFGEFLGFSVRLDPAIPVEKAMIYVSSEQHENVLVDVAQVDENGQITYNYVIQPGVLRPFMQIFFKFEVTLKDGQTLTSPLYTSDYVDTRFEWTSREDPQIVVSWVKGDGAFGQAVFDSAQQGIKRMEQLVAPASDGPVRIYVYPSAADLQSALNLAGENWIAGHASPDLGVVLTSIAPGPEQKLEMEREIPHEMAHILLYRQVGDRYENLPVSVVEINPNPDYQRALTAASQNNSLLPFSSLCQVFPPDAAGAFQAYAQSESLVKYIKDKFGATGIQALISSYADGLDCNRGMQQALGMTLDDLDKNWRQDVLGENITGAAVQKLLPFGLLLLAAVIFPLSLVISAMRWRKNNGS
jgi:hypothetical protein